MDLLKSIKQKSEYFADTEEDQGVSSVVSHIEIAERHYQSAKTGNDYLYNDVIYRCNQAFEGSLKEAYRIITGKDPNKITPHKIEKHFEQNSVLKERVLTLFKNYRTEWRNKSTHDYKLYFFEQEALLAIVSISAFINILFDQMIEKRAYDKETTEIASGNVKRVPVYQNSNLLDSAIELLKGFSEVIPGKVSGTALGRITESEINGSLAAYVNEFGGDIRLYPEYPINLKGSDRRYWADFLLERSDEKLLIEVKNYRKVSKNHLSDGSDQLSAYMAESGIETGVLYIPPASHDFVMEEKHIKRMVGDKAYKILQIYPKKN